VLDQFDLFVGEWPDFLAVDGDRADQFSLLEHRHGDHGPSAGNIDETCACMLRQCRGVGNVNQLLRVGDLAKRVLRTRANERFALSQFHIGRWRTMECNNAEPTVIIQQQRPELCFAYRRCAFQNGLKNWTQLAGGAGDDLQNLRCRGLPLKRLGEIVRALTQLVEQPRVLDGDDGLRGEVLHQFYLLLGEWPHLLAVDRHRTDHRVFFQHRHKENSSNAYEFNGLDSQRIAVDVDPLSRKIGNVNDLFRCGGAAETSSRASAKHRVLSSKLHQYRRSVVQSRGAIVFSVIEVE